MFILGSCKALNLRYPGCCMTFLSQICTNKDCHCDQQCHSYNDCCSDIADIGCHPISNGTLGKINSGNHTINY